MQVEGRALRVGQPLPDTWLRGASEAWDVLGFQLAINEDGTYLVGGSTNASSADDLLSVNGEFTVREGDLLDGRALYADKRAMVMSEAEDVGLLWRTAAPGTTQRPHTLFFNGRALLSDGAALDVDGDGADDASVDELWSNSVVVGEDRRVYVSADIDPSGVALALLRLRVDDLESDASSLSVSADRGLELTLFPPRGQGATQAVLYAALDQGVRGVTPGGAGGPGARPVHLTERTVVALDGFNTARTSFRWRPEAGGSAAGQTLKLWYVTSGGAAPYRSRTLRIDLVP